MLFAFAFEHATNMLLLVIHLTSGLGNVAIHLDLF